jgi:hypothetical protein
MCLTRRHLRRDVVRACNAANRDVPLLPRRRRFFLYAHFFITSIGLICDAMRSSLPRRHSGWSVTYVREMIVWKVLLSFVVFFGLCTQALSDSNPDLAKLIVGTWAPTRGRESNNEREGEALGIYGMEQFRSGGTGTTTVYRGGLCRQLLHARDFSWRIEKGILVTTKADGRTLRDSILSIRGDSLIMKSLDSGEMEYRTRRIDCRGST